jgi:type IV secretory pathway ATPase VirB11/archaellum biosynthesis ATPase/intein/homing endonuclease
MPKISIPKIKMPSFNIREKLQKLRDKLKIPRRKGAKGEPSKFKFPPIVKRLKALLKISKPPKAVVETKFHAEPLLAVVEGDIIDKYMIDQAAVFIVDRHGKGYYLIQEPPLTEEEQRIYSLLMENLFYSLLPTIKLPEDPIKYVESFIYEVAEDLGILELVHKSFSKYKYYITKDAFGYGPLHVLMNDPNIEEISCVSYGRPITVIHRKASQYDWLETNVVFASEDEVGKFVQKLAQKTGKSATVAIPFVDAMTAEGDRIAVTFSNEVTLPGSTFSIRRFPIEPLSMANLIKFNTISPLMAAYLWILVEHRGFILTIGPMSSGKTTMLNCLLTMISPNLKIVTVEDSVDGNMEILAIVAGKPVVTTIKELVDSVLDKKGFKTVDSGHEVGVSNEIEILTLDENGKATLQKPDRFIRHFVEKEGMLIQTATGRSIKTTIDHSLYSLDQTGALRPIRCKTLKPGDYLATLGKIPFNCERVSLDLTTRDEIAERFSIDKNSMIRYPQARNFQSLPSKIELDEDLAFLCGVWLADGFCGEKTVGFSTGYNNEVSGRMYRTAEKMGLKIKRHSDGTSLQIHSVIFKKVLHGFPELKGDDYNRRVPPLFFTTEKTVTASLLRGYFTCDGNVNRYEIETSSASPNLLKDIQSLLLRFGIVLRINLQKHRVGTYGGIGIYRGRICGAKMLKRFKENIGFEDSLKTSKLIKACSNRTKPSVDPIPLTGNLTEVADAVKLLPKHRVKARLNNALKRGYAYRDDLIMLGELVPTFKGTKIYRLAESDVYFDRITSVKPVKIKEKVYDLGVPRTERFVCEGFICHNTPEIKIPHKNWERFKARRTYAITETKYDVDLFDLVKLSLRYRPDYISVGEIRGEEAKSLIQAASLGHGAISTLHAESPASAFIRLTTTPMEIEPSSLGLISAIVTLHRIRMPDGSVSRRVVDISEVILDNEGKPQIINIFTRDPTTDEMCPSTAEEVLAKSKKLELLTGPAGWSQKKLLKQLKIRAKYLQELVEQEKTTYDLFSDAMFKFYSEVEKGAA